VAVSASATNMISRQPPGRGQALPGASPGSASTPAVESPADEVVARVAATGQRRALAAALARLKTADRDTLLAGRLGRTHLRPGGPGPPRARGHGPVPPEPSPQEDLARRSTTSIPPRARARHGLTMPTGTWRARAAWVVSEFGPVDQQQGVAVGGLQPGSAAARHAHGRRGTRATPRRPGDSTAGRRRPGRAPVEPDLAWRCRLIMLVAMPNSQGGRVRWDRS